MGDGHHAWASAEVTLAVRNAFVMESWMVMNRHHTLTLLGGIPGEFFGEGKDFGIWHAPVPEGFVDIVVSPKGREATIAIEFRKAGFLPEGSWVLSLPPDVESLCIDGCKSIHLGSASARHRVIIPAESQRIRIIFRDSA